MKSIRHLLKRSIGSSRSYTRLFALLALIAVVGSVSVSASPIETVTQAIKDAWSSAVGVISGATSEQATQETSAPQELTVCPGGCQFGTLEDAVAAARPGDTVKVLAGNYYLSGNVVINKPLTLVGPNETISPVRGSRSAEAVIALPQNGSIVVASDNVIISGFKFTSQGGSATRGAIIGGTEVSSASGQVVVSQNVFENINVSSGAAIFVSDSSTGNDSGNWSIRDNGFAAITGTDATAVRVANTRSAATVVGNSFTNIDGAAVQVVNTVGSVIDANSISGVGQEGIRVGAGSADTFVRGNSVDRAQIGGDYTKGAIMLESGLGVGTVVENNLLTNSLTAMAVAGASQELVIRFNHFASNNANGFYATGTDASAVINAENNYWGAEFGPANFGSQGSRLSSEGPQIDVEPYISNFENRSLRRPRAGFWPRANATTASKGEAGAAVAPLAPSVACFAGNLICNFTQNTAHTTIQEAIDAANAYDVILFAGVTFTENVVIDIPVDLRGAYYGWSANDPGRTGAETIVQPAVAGSATPSSSSPSSIFRIDSTVTTMYNLRINGFTLEGNNTSGSVTRGISRNSTDIDVDAAFAVSTADGVRFIGDFGPAPLNNNPGFGFYGNRVNNVGLDPTTGAAVQLKYTGTNALTGQDNDMIVNEFTNVGSAVLLERNYSWFYYNVVTNAGIGVNIGSHQAAGTASPDIFSNTIQASSVEHFAEPIGISIAVQGSGATRFDIGSNYITFTGAAATKATGIRVLNVLSDPNIGGNYISGGQFGYVLTGNDSSVVDIDSAYVATAQDGAKSSSEAEFLESAVKRFGGRIQPPTSDLGWIGGIVTGAMTGVRATTDETGGGTYNINGLEIYNASVAGIEAYDQGLGTVSVNATGVELSGTSSGKGVFARGGTAAATITNSTIIEQTGFQYDNFTSRTQTATCNWWGAATGPAAGAINQNTGTVTSTPFKKVIGATECVAPSVSAVTANDVTYGSNVTVSATVTDASAISAVEYRVGTTGSWTAMSNGGSGSSYSATITKPAVGSYTVYVRARDTFDNESDGTASDTFTVSAKTLTITGLTGDNKAYDGNANATASGTAALSGVESGDTVNLGGTPTFTFSDENVGTGKTITTTGYTISGTDSGNYTLTQPSLTGDITAATLTVTGLTGDNKTYDGNATATASGTAALSGVVSGDTVTLTGTPTFSFADETVGTGKTISTTGYTLGGADAGNYTLTQPSLTGDITAKTLTITGLTGDNKTYDGTTAATATGTAALSGVVSGDTVTLGGSGTYTFADKNAGTGKTISTTGFTISGADAGNYTLTQPSLTGNITKAVLNIDANAGSKTYGSIDPDFSSAYYSFSGYQTGDNSGNVTVTGLALCTRITGESVGTYTLTCYTGTLSSTNYTFTSGSTALFTINAKALTVSGLTGDNKTYDGNSTASASGTASLVGVVSGDVVTLGGTPSFSFADKNVGTAKTITTTGYTIGGASAGNYTLTQPSLTGDITAKGLTVTGLTGDNKTYDGNTTATASGTAALSGVVSGDTVTLGGTASFSFADKNVGTGKTITTTGYTLGGADAGNYSLTQPSLTGDITAKTLTITGITGTNKTYDGNTTASVTGTAALSGVVGSDDVTLGGTPTFTFASKNVGTGISITAAGYTISGTDSGNYSLTQPTGLTADITAKELTVTGLSATSREFDATTNVTVTGTAALSGVVSPDVVTLSGSPTWAFATASVGTAKTINRTGDYSIGGADAGNYTLTQPTLTADIFAKTLTGTISVNPKVYDGNANATISACTLTGIVPAAAAVSCNFAGATAQFNDANVGTGKTISIVSGLTLTGADAGNYSFDGSASGADGIITKKQLFLDAVANSKTYGASDPSLTYTLSGFVTGESTSNVAITGTAGACTRTSGETVAGSPYTISCLPGTLAATNYSFATGASADFTINKKNLTVSGLSGDNKTYDGNTTATASGTGSLVGVEGADVVSLTGTPVYTFASKNVGTAISISTTGFTLGGADAGNYSLTQPTLSADITAKNLTISGATASNRTYNGGTSATVNFASASLTGVVAPDVVTINSSAYSASFASANVGTGIAVTVTGVTLSGADAGNYTVSQPSGLTADITKATANVDAVAVSKIWGNTDPVVTYSFSGLFSPDTTATLVTTGAGVCNRVIGEDVGTYVITCTPGTLSSTNYDFVAGATALLTINPMPYGTVYNTPVGTNVNPQWGNTSTPSAVTVNFASVTTSGNTTVSVLSPGDPGYIAPPTGVSTGIAPLYFDITTTAVYTTPITVCFGYPSGNYFGSTPKLYHYSGGAWADVTTTTDTVNFVVCGSVTSFSPFMLGATLTPTSAGVSLGGRVLDPAGRAVANANIRVIDLETGSIGMAKTNQFGRYSIGGLAAGKGYVVTASSKSFPGGISREVSLVDSLADFDLSFGSTTASASATEGVSTAPAPTTTVTMTSVKSNDDSTASGRGKEAAPVSQPRPTVVIDSTAPKAKSKKKKKDNQK